MGPKRLARTCLCPGSVLSVRMPDVLVRVWQQAEVHKWSTYGKFNERTIYKEKRSTTGGLLPSTGLRENVPDSRKSLGCDYDYA